MWTLLSEKKSEIMNPTTKSALYKGTQGHQHLDISFMYKWQAQKQQRNDAVTVSGDIGSLTAGSAPADNTSEWIHSNRFVLSA